AFGDAVRERPVAKRYQGLRQLRGERSKPRSEPGGEDDRARHLSSLPSASASVPAQQTRRPGRDRVSRAVMRWLGKLLLPPVVGAASQVACGTSAVGVEDCRSIERARCQAARSCDFGIDSNSDEEVCLRYARDNCLHGMLVQAPTAGSVTKCVNAINAA